MLCETPSIESVGVAASPRRADAADGLSDFEEWRPCESLNGYYYVSSLGRVRREKTNGGYTFKYAL